MLPSLGKRREQKRNTQVTLIHTTCTAIQPFSRERERSSGACSHRCKRNARCPYLCRKRPTHAPRLAPTRGDARRFALGLTLGMALVRGRRPDLKSV